MDNSKQLTDTGRQLTRHGEPLHYREGLYQLSDHCYGWLVPNGSWGETNIGLIECGGKSVLIDTCWDLNFTRQMLDSMEPVVARSPIDTVINTHSDGDHCWGNQLFADRTIIATHACQQQMHHLKPQSMSAIQLGCKALKHLPFGAVDSFSRYMGAMLAPYQFKGIQITDPSFTFQQEHCVTVNGRDLVLYEVGPGHTDGDAIVYVPDQRVAYAGDIAFIGSTPVMWSGPLENLVAGLQRLLALDARVLVPGHGPLASRQDIQHLIDYWHFVDEQLQPEFHRGRPPHEAAAAILHSTAFLGSPYARWSAPERLVTNAYTLYRHWGAPADSPPDPLATLDLMRRQARVAEGLTTPH